MQQESKFNLFISYSRKDREITEQLAKGLNVYGIEVIYDESALELDQNIEDNLNSAVNTADGVLVLLAPNYTYLEKTYKSRQLERKWANIATLEAVLKNPENKFIAQKHSFVVRVYEFKKVQLAKDFQFVTGDTNYVIDPKVAELLKKL